MIHRIASEMVSYGRFTRSLLPVQQGIAFWEQQSHILLLQRGELALLQFFVAESQPIDIRIDSGIGSHFRERGLLTQKFLSFAGNQFFGLPVLLFLLFVLPGQFGQRFSSRNQLPERGFASLDLIEQMPSPWSPSSGRFCINSCFTCSLSFFSRRLFFTRHWSSVVKSTSVSLARWISIAFLRIVSWLYSCRAKSPTADTVACVSSS